MKIVEQSAELLDITPNAEQLIERAGRTCYKSEDRVTPTSARDFVEMLKRRGHLSVLEHAKATIRFVCDRGISHELVRHRLASFSQESTRYCNYGADKHGKEITVVRPPGLSDADRIHWRCACREAEDSYLALLEHDVPPQIARSVLPTCLKTEVVVTANFREWLLIFEQRTSPQAHPQIREIMIKALELLHEKCPVVFAFDPKDKWDG